jgi:hypothetical protein
MADGVRAKPDTTDGASRPAPLRAYLSAIHPSSATNGSIASPASR